MFISICKSLIVSLFIFLGVACSPKQWGEKPADGPSGNNKIGNEIRCLGNVLPIMQDFVKGEAQATDVSKSWQCFSSALELFKNRVRGEHPQGYKSTELKDFFERYFLKEGIEISPALLTEIMRIKQIFVGGENQVVTRKEIEDLIRFSGEMENYSLELLPSMKILSLRWTIDSEEQLPAAEVDFELAKARSEKILLQLASRIESKGQSYKIANFVTLMEEMEKMYSSQWDFLVSLKKGLPLFQKLKKTLMGTDETLVLANEWRQFGLLGVRSYLLYLRYHYFVQKSPPSAGTDPDYRLAFKSIDDLLITGGEFISQKPTARLDVKEVIEVFEQAKKLFPNLEVTEDLLIEVMKVKTLLVGGTVKDFSAEDFDTARAKLGSVRRVAELYKKWSEIFTGTWKMDSKGHDQARNDFQAAESDLLKIAESLGPLFETSYDLRDLLKLLKAYEVTFPPREDSQPISSAIERYLSLGISVKNLVLNDWSAQKHRSSSLNSVIQKDDWSPLLETAARIYTKYLYFNYFLKDQNWMRGFGLQDSEILANSTHQALLEVLRVRGQGQERGIAAWEMALVVEKAKEAKLIDLNWSSSVLNSLFDRLIQRLLTAPEKHAAGVRETEVTPSALQTLFSEVSIFFQAQSKFDVLLTEKPVWSQSDLRKAFEPRVTVSDQELSRILAVSASMGLDSEGRLFISPKRAQSYDESSFNRLNLIRAVARWMIRSYAGSLDRALDLSYLTAEEVDLIFADFRPIAIEIGLLDPKNERFAKNRFLEANLFTPVSDGNELLSFTEGSWLLADILSGLKINKGLSVSYDKRCGPQTRVDVDCALGVIAGQASKQLGSMPEMVKYLQNLDVGNWREMNKDLFRAIGWSDTNRTILATDLALYPHIVQYIESVMRRADTNDDGVIHYDEAMKIEPVFRPLLQKVSGFDDELWLRALFAYVLVYGNAPDNIADELFFAADWVGRDGQWPIQADRKQLAKILGVITEKARSTSSKSRVSTPRRPHRHK